VPIIVNRNSHGDTEQRETRLRIDDMPSPNNPHERNRAPIDAAHSAAEAEGFPGVQVCIRSP